MGKFPGKRVIMIVNDGQWVNSRGPYLKAYLKYEALNIQVRQDQILFEALASEAHF